MQQQEGLLPFDAESVARHEAELKELVDRVAGEVKHAEGAGVAYQVGTMIELPRAALTAAIVASLAGKANSIATIFSLDIYKHFFNPQASEKKLITVGKLTVILSMVIASLIAPALSTLPMSAMPRAPPNSRRVSFNAEATPCSSAGSDPVMAEVEGVDVPAGGSVTFEPGWPRSRPCGTCPSRRPRASPRSGR